MLKQEWSKASLLPEWSKKEQLTFCHFLIPPVARGTLPQGPFLLAPPAFSASLLCLCLKPYIPLNISLGCFMVFLPLPYIPCHWKWWVNYFWEHVRHYLKIRTYFRFFWVDWELQEKLSVCCKKGETGNVIRNNRALSKSWMGAEESLEFYRATVLSVCWALIGTRFLLKTASQL